MAKILIVEDDKGLSGKLRQLLEAEGWTVECIGSGEDALQLLENFKYDFVLLDWSLPGITGVDVCRRYRNSGGESAIIFLTGHSQVHDKETGLDAGGDDYLTKPFEIRELFARMRSIQRRQSGMKDGRLQINDVILDLKLRTLSKGDARIHVSATESNLISYLFAHPNQFFSASDLFNAVWTADTEASEGTVKSYIKLLRRKFESLGCPDLIKTVRGSGYMVERK